MRQALYLISKGIPFDIAFEIDETKRSAWCIMFSEIEGGRKYNFITNEFEEVKK
jgi:hypothetical protein